mmetsp:Transcript_58415/g.65321  ORF Transcript_58415/g.65321 Transcript_58415/m.65321 type:complete len:255 (-) Transcript_58415:66-830(-)
MIKFVRRDLPKLILVFLVIFITNTKTLAFAPSPIDVSTAKTFQLSKKVGRLLPTKHRHKSPILITNIQQRRQNNDSRLNAVMDIVGVSPEPIHTAFAFATFGPQPFWLLMILVPNLPLTKNIMGKMDVVIFFALVHFFIVAASIVQPDSTAPLLEFNDVFNPSKDSQAAFMNMVTNYPNFVAEEWPHVLTWDLFVGRWIWLDGLKRGIFTPHSVLFTNLIGPPGLLLHWITCLVTKKGFGANEVPQGDNADESL